MKKIARVSLCVAALIWISGVANSMVIQVQEVHIELAWAGGGTAMYAHDPGTLDWSGGGSGYLKLQDGSILDFQQPEDGVSIDGGLGDVASIIESSISFNSGTFTVEFENWRNGKIVIEGAISADQTYDESIAGTYTFGSVLAGQALVDVEAYYVEGNIRYDDQVTWLAPFESILTTNLIGVYIDGTTNSFTDYTSQDYWTESLSLSIVIPEPATLSLLSLGAVALLRRKRK